MDRKSVFARSCESEMERVSGTHPHTHLGCGYVTMHAYNGDGVEAASRGIGPSAWVLPGRDVDSTARRRFTPELTSFTAARVTGEQHTRDGGDAGLPCRVESRASRARTTSSMLCGPMEADRGVVPGTPRTAYLRRWGNFAVIMTFQSVIYILKPKACCADFQLVSTSRTSLFSSVHHHGPLFPTRFYSTDVLNL